MDGPKPVDPSTLPDQAILPALAELGGFREDILAGMELPADSFAPGTSCFEVIQQLRKVYNLLKQKHLKQDENLTKQAGRTATALADATVLENLPQMGDESILRSTSIMPSQILQAMSADVHELIHGRRIPLTSYNYTAATSPAQEQLELFQQLGVKLSKFSCTNNPNWTAQLYELKGWINFYSAYLTLREEKVTKVTNILNEAFTQLDLTVEVGCSGGSITYALTVGGSFESNIGSQELLDGLPDQYFNTSDVDSYLNV